MIVADDFGAGTAALLLHGQPGEAADWDRVVPLLSSRMRVLVPDRPGYGRTGGAAAGFAENADALAALLAERDAAPAVVVGHSWAGGVAIEMGLRHPDLVRSVVLVSSVGGRGSLEELDRALALPVVGPLMVLSGFMLLRAPSVRRFLARAFLPDTASVDFGRYATGLPDVVRSFTAEQRAMVAELPSLAARLGDLRVPAVVVIGARDRVVPPSSQEALTEALPAARIVRVPRAGHLVPQDAPVDVADAIYEAAQ